MICQGHNHHMERLAEAINFLITKIFTRKDFYLLFAARCILSTFEKLFQIAYSLQAFLPDNRQRFFHPLEDLGVHP